MQFGWLTLALSPSPEEDAARIEQQIATVLGSMTRHEDYIRRQLKQP